MPPLLALQRGDRAYRETVSHWNVFLKRTAGPWSFSSFISLSWDKIFYSLTCSYSVALPLFQEVPPFLKWHLQNDEPGEMLHKLVVLGSLCKSWKANTTIFYTILFSLCSSTSTGPLLASNLNAFLFTVWTVGLSISIFRLLTVFGLHSWKSHTSPFWNQVFHP